MTELLKLAIMCSFTFSYFLLNLYDLFCACFYLVFYYDVFTFFVKRLELL